MSPSPEHPGHIPGHNPGNEPQFPNPQAAGQSEAGPVQEQLSPADMERVAKYLNSPVHRVKRKPFRPWLMMLALLAVVAGLSLTSVLISWLVL